ncbi:hypothetical protein Gotur_022020, partial [Gossypium turneri]
MLLSQYHSIAAGCQFFPSCEVDLSDHQMLTYIKTERKQTIMGQPDLGWMRRLQQILGRKHQRNLHAIYVLHPTFHLKTAIFALQMFVDKVVWKKVVYVDRLLQLFKYVPREQLTIPDFAFQARYRSERWKGSYRRPSNEIRISSTI